MAGPEFFSTVVGRHFFDGTMPRLVGAIQDLAKGSSFVKIPGTDRWVNRAHVIFVEPCTGAHHGDYQSVVRTTESQINSTSTVDEVMKAMIA